MPLNISNNKLDILSKALTGMAMRCGVFFKLPVTLTTEMPLGFSRYEVDPKDGKIVLRAGRRMMTDKDLGL